MGQPAGTVTLVFTDIEGSSDLWERHREAFAPVLREHHRLMREHLERWDGFEVETEGDAFFIAFARASDAVHFAVDAQRAFAAYPWGTVIPGLRELRVRIGMHTGEPLRNEDRGRITYNGPPTNRAARVSSAAHGRQVLLSEATRVLAGPSLLPEVELIDLGLYELKGVGAERLWQVCHPDLPREFPPVRLKGSEHPNNLPSPVSTFIGREVEVFEVSRMLRSQRMVTLTGPGGVGKTRMSLEIARELLPDFPGGVFLVELAAVRDVPGVLSTLSQVLGVREAADTPLLAAIKTHLQGRRTLLVLDNLEQVLEAAVPLGELLAAVPELHVLGTSRAPLQIRGEQEYPVPLLVLPELKRLPELEALTQYSSVALFVDRARAAKPGFEIHSENAPAIAEICVRLDGLALAIELAAARVRVLPPAALLQRLECRLKLLTGGVRDLPTRQQTLRNAIAWSHELLSEAEQTLFRRLGVFAGGWSLEAADSVVNAVGDPLDVFEGLASLVEKSLVRQVEHGDGEPRFLMLETIREYALECLDASGEAPGLKAAYAEHYRALAEEIQARPRGASRIAGWAQLGLEHDNLRAVLRWAIDGKATELGLRLCFALWRFWALGAFLSEGRRWLAPLLALPDAANHRAAWAGAQYADGCLAEDLGDYATALKRYETSLAVRRDLGDRAGIADCYTALGSVHANRGDYVAARSWHEQSLAIWRELADEAGISVALSNLGTLAWSEGNYEAAHTYQTESLALRRKLGDIQGVAVSLASLGLLASREGRRVDARAYYEESLAVMRSMDNRGGVAVLLNNLAELAAQEGDYSRAGTLLRESLSLLLEIEDRYSTCFCLETLGSMLHRRGDSLAAVRIFAAADALRATLGAPLPPKEREAIEVELDDLRQILQAKPFQQEWDEGAAASLEEAIHYGFGRIEGG